MKNRTHIPVDTYEKQAFKKRFLERIVQEEDAKQQIRQYTRSTKASSVSLPEARDVETKRPL